MNVEPIGIGIGIGIGIIAGWRKQGKAVTLTYCGQWDSSCSQVLICDNAI